MIVDSTVADEIPSPSSSPSPPKQQKGIYTCMMSFMTPTSAGCTLEMVLALDLSLTDAEGCQPCRDTRPSENYLVLPTKVVLDGGKSLLVHETLNGRDIMGIELRTIYSTTEFLSEYGHRRSMCATIMFRK